MSDHVDVPEGVVRYTPVVVYKHQAPRYGAAAKMQADPEGGYIDVSAAPAITTKAVEEKDAEIERLQGKLAGQKLIRDLSAEAGGAASEPDELPDALAAVEGRVAQLEQDLAQAVEAERERLREVDGPLLLAIREAVGTNAEALELRDEDGDPVWANHATVEALADAVSNAALAALEEADRDR